MSTSFSSSITGIPLSGSSEAIVKDLVQRLMSTSYSLLGMVDSNHLPPETCAPAFSPSELTPKTCAYYVIITHLNLIFQLNLYSDSDSNRNACALPFKDSVSTYSTIGALLRRVEVTILFYCYVGLGLANQPITFLATLHCGPIS